MEMISSISSMGMTSMFLMFASFIVWAWAIIDILKSDFKDSTNKLIWLLVVIFLTVLGALLYFLFGRKQKVDLIDNKK